MANEFKHKDPGSELTQAEYISACGDGHIFACQATGDILYASSSTVLKNLGKGAANTLLSMGGSCIPAWTASPSVTDLTIGGGCITLTGAATDIDLIDNNACALSFDASGQAGILAIDTQNCAEGVKMSGKLTVTGAISSTGALTVGVDDTGHDVKFFGAAAGAFMLYDQSCNLLEVRGATAAGPGHLKLTTGEATVVACDVLGKIEFQAPAECGTDAIVAGANIQAVAQATFSATVNNTDLLFMTGLSGAATEKFRFTANGELGVGGANYGNCGQVLTSGGACAAPSWACASGGGPCQASITAIKCETNQDTYVPPDLLKHSPGVAKAWVQWEQCGAHGIITSYNMTSVTDGGVGETDHLWNVDFAGTNYVVTGGSRGGRFLDNVDCQQGTTGTTTRTRCGADATVSDAESYMQVFGTQ